jgi:hypothetical protein
MLLEAVCNERERESYLRGGRRYKTRRVIAITQLSHKGKPTRAVVRDISITGIKIEASLPLGVGHTLRVDLGGSTVLAEVVHCVSESGRMHIGLKLAHPLSNQELTNFLARRR